MFTTILAVYAISAWIAFGVWSIKCYYERKASIVEWEKSAGDDPIHRPLIEANKRHTRFWIAEQFCYWITAPLWFWFVVLMVMLGRGVPF